MTREEVIAELNGALPVDGSLQGPAAIPLATIKRAAELLGASDYAQGVVHWSEDDAAEMHKAYFRRAKEAPAGTEPLFAVAMVGYKKGFADGQIRTLIRSTDYAQGVEDAAKVVESLSGALLAETVATAIRNLTKGQDHE